LPYTPASSNKQIAQDLAGNKKWGQTNLATVMIDYIEANPEDQQDDGGDTVLQDAGVAFETGREMIEESADTE